MNMYLAGLTLYSTSTTIDSFERRNRRHFSTMFEHTTYIPISESIRYRGIIKA